MTSPAIINAGSKSTATIIFLHGLGDTGHGWASQLASMNLPHIKFICPTAPIAPVTLNGGFMMPSWFDLKSLDSMDNEDEAGIHKARDEVHAMVNEEKQKGTPYNRIMLGGFSQGGALALYSTLTNNNTLAGTIALSSWLPLRNEFPKGILGNKATPILQCHGESDPLVKFSYGKQTSEILKKFTENAAFKSYKHLDHSSNAEEMADVKSFILKHLPSI